jgi:hypothetical protein
MLAPMSASSSRTAVSARVHQAALAELRALNAENACLRDELRRHASGALQIRAAHRNAQHDLMPGSERCMGGLRELIFTPLLGRFFRR